MVSPPLRNSQSLFSADHDAAEAGRNSNRNSRQPSPSWPLSQARDIIELPRPYGKITSDDVKRWEAELTDTGGIDEVMRAEGSIIVGTNSKSNNSTRTHASDAVRACLNARLP